MTLGLLFWICMLLWLVIGVWIDYPSGPRLLGRGVLLFILLLVLGWHSFGAPIH